MHFNETPNPGALSACTSVAIELRRGCRARLRVKKRDILKLQRHVQESTIYYTYLALTVVRLDIVFKQFVTL